MLVLAYDDLDTVGAINEHEQRARTGRLRMGGTKLPSRADDHRSVRARLLELDSREMEAQPALPGQRDLKTSTTR